jgi:hypothetical protein
MEGIEGFGTSLSADFVDASGAATERTRSWGTSNQEVVAQAMRDLEADDNFRRWLAAEITWAWPEYARRMNGLFTSLYIPQLATILKTSESDLAQLHEQTLDTHFVQQVVKTRPDHVLKPLSKAFVAATLLRGRYYCELARLSKQQLLQHPMRTSESTHPVTADLFTPNRYRFSCSMAETFFVKILTTSVFAERKLEDRIRLWLENVSSARPALLNINSEQRKKLRTHVSSLEIARDEAIAVAKYLNLRTYPKYFEEAVDITIGLGVTALTSFVLQPWSAFATGLASTLASRHGLSRRFTNAAANRRGRLERLASSPAGGIFARASGV